MTAEELEPIIKELVTAAVEKELAEDWILRKPQSEQNEMREDGTRRLTDLMHSLAAAVNVKDVPSLYRWSQSIRMRATEKLFARMLGIKRPTTQKALETIMADWLGQAWTDHVAAVRRDREERREKDRIERETKERNRVLLAEVLAPSPITGGESRRTTVKQLIDDCIEAGWRPVASQRGFTKSIQLTSPSGRSFTFFKTIEIEYANRAYQEKREREQAAKDAMDDYNYVGSPMHY